MKDYDVCVIGSGAGAGPIAFELSKSGYSVAVIEKGKWFKEKDFSKDELACCRRDVYTPDLSKEFHLVENYSDSNEEWIAESSAESGQSFWNGNCVGGSSNFMSGYFLRLKPEDFRLRTEFGEIKDANVVDWPISYQDLEPYYAKVESVVGISGRVVDHPNQEPRSTKDFPFPPLKENIVSGMVDSASKELGYDSIPVPRAILSEPLKGRSPCYYSNFCGSYGCSSGAKGSSRAALLDQAVGTGNCTVIPESMAVRLDTDKADRVSELQFIDKEGARKTISAKIFVVACQAIESSRLLLLSAGRNHRDGLGNSNGQLGKNLIFSGGGSGGGTFYLDELSESIASELKKPGLFVNRALQDWYVINDKAFGVRSKGGTVDFIFEHANPIRRAHSVKWSGSRLLWGTELQQALKKEFTERKHLRIEIFNDWLPNSNCFVGLGNKNDVWGNPVANVRVGAHEQDLKVGRYIAEKAEGVLRQMKLHDIYSSVSSSPPANLMAGGCRFGTDPESSYLDRDCRSHEVENLFVADGSFMPTGGSVPFTWTIYANSFRVADKIKAQL